MAYQVSLTAEATRNLDALPDKLYGQVRRHIDALATVPRPAGSKKLAGTGSRCRRTALLELPCRFASAALCDGVSVATQAFLLRGAHHFDNCGIMEEKEAVLALSALAQESRLKAFRLLVRAGPEGRAAGAIAEELGIPPATLSFHLSHLTQAGLTETKRVGRSIIYALRVDGIRQLLGFLTTDCCQGRPELCLPTRVTLTQLRKRKKEPV